ncbi:MAG TPA: hypothetical protein PLG60_02690 [Acidimicrobiales bacterium]|nr:hypothetical protein [Acidimicrobiales bacterium]
MSAQVDDVRTCTWWRPLKVAYVGERSVPTSLAEIQARLLESFRRQGHTIVTTSEADIDLLIDVAAVPDGDEPPALRMPERAQPLMLTVMRDYHLARRPDNLVVLVGVRESFDTWTHAEVVSTARVVMARIGSPKVVFVSASEPAQLTYCTLEGGHPSEALDHVDRLRDRLVASACAEEVGGRYDVVEGALSAETWRETTIPDDIVRAGHRMHQLGLLPPPQQISEYVSPHMAQLYQRYLGLKGFSEGMLFAVDPLTQSTMVTASGSWDVDKRALHRDEVTALGGTVENRVQVLAPVGVRPKGPSVEAAEVLALLGAVPLVRLGRDATGEWRVDPQGEVEVPIVRAGFHAHVGITAADPAIVETIEPDRQRYPFGFGCGTDLMCEVARDTVERSKAINDASDSRRFVRWPMLYHGEMVIELWKGETSSAPFTTLLDLFDPATSDAVTFRADHVDQPH